MDKKKTLVIGASINPERYSYLATMRLLQAGYEVALIGAKHETVLENTIYAEKRLFTDIHTVTMYISPKRQPEYYDYILSLKPQRVIFNPGTENEEFEILLKKNKIETDCACTLILLATGQY